MFKELIASYDGYDILEGDTFYFWGVTLTDYAKASLGVENPRNSNEEVYLHIDPVNSSITYIMVEIDTKTNTDSMKIEKTFQWRMEILK